MDIQAFFADVAGGDLEAVRRQLDDAPFLVHVKNPDEDAWQELTALHGAAKYGHLDLARLLIERGAEVYSNPQSTYPPVIIAAWNNQQELVDYFLKEIPDKANGTNKLGVAVNLASRQGWTDLIRKHIEADPLAVHQRGWIGDVPLHWACHNGYTEIIELLLDAGADIEADEINCYGGKPLHWASESKPEAVKLLLGRGANVNSRNIKADSEMCGFTPLIMHVRQKPDRTDLAEILLDAGADIDAVDANGQSALAVALEHDLTEIAEFLRSHGASD